jgi:GTPase SAR1 family protein
VAFHPTKPILATLGERETVIRIWQLDVDAILDAQPPEETAQYKNAKVVLLGDSGVGKSGLALVLTGHDFEATESTHAFHIWTFDKHEADLDDSEARETLLWDMAGQPGYRVFHKLHLNDVAVALVVFDAHLLE